MSMISANSVSTFYQAYYSIVQESVPLALFLSNIVEKMDEEQRDYFKVAAKRTKQNQDSYFLFERSNDELVFKGVRTKETCLAFPSGRNKE
ncbi:DUF5960 family protein [Enterococcus sp. AZ072]|uniref:DUF5960 family protein n=1 Tax=unclassified Enterococcus TaxID=2608891 RepID=UPI003D29F90E